MRLKDFLSELGIDQDLIKQVPDNIYLGKTTKRRGPKIKIKSKPMGFYYRSGISTYKVKCPHCGAKVFASYTCPECGRCMEVPKSDPVPIQKARDLKKARELAKKWGYEVVKKNKGVCYDNKN